MKRIVNCDIVIEWIDGKTETFVASEFSIKEPFFDVRAEKDGPVTKIPLQFIRKATCNPNFE